MFAKNAGNMQMIQWLFFDLGSTLIDESECAEYRIQEFFDVIMSSAEVGMSKPDLEIFRTALDKVKCLPADAYMIGDRLDNDIEPAAQIGMHTIWVRQGSFAYGNLSLIQHQPDHIVDGILEILEYV